MWWLISYLNSSNLVATFQQACGLYPAPETTETGQVREHEPSNLTASKVHHRKGDLVANGRSLSQDDNSNYNHTADDCKINHASTQYEVVMYIGQVMKDILKLPRPTVPPVVKLEQRVHAEYGMPSTHAMGAIAISFTLLFSAQERVQFTFEVGLVLAVVLSGLVCLSRLYTGMHSALDVICGILISALILGIIYPHWSILDSLQLNSPLSPAVALALPLYLCYKYPELDHYSTTRGDTTIIMAVSAGCSVGYWVNHQLGQTFEPTGPFPVTLPPMNAVTFALGVTRFGVGLAILVLTRQTAKWVSLRLLCRCYGVAHSDIVARQRKEIEVPYKFSTYLVIGLVNSMAVCRVFSLVRLL
ncbi:sphingosine-1-phosphate phosphatase 2 isoform X3 [Electrophorus electricus]|uniref:sphingosine-1-phosphate phosphatase 2 isoform X3 n=1 Tax=Electrophorus electricus TaxID=8005 RepID=UPI000F09E398|nr:sphingosine-1-phosphate phosphatase 2 isoform X3 [Electrophorus electricus]